MQGNVMGMISRNQCMLSHLKASEPSVAFQSHEVPLFAERIALKRQVGQEHGHASTRASVSRDAGNTTPAKTLQFSSKGQWKIDSG